MLFWSGYLTYSLVDISHFKKFTLRKVGCVLNVLITMYLPGSHGIDEPLLYLIPSTRDNSCPYCYLNQIWAECTFWLPDQVGNTSIHWLKQSTFYWLASWHLIVQYMVPVSCCFVQPRCSRQLCIVFLATSNVIF